MATAITLPKRWDSVATEELIHEFGRLGPPCVADFNGDGVPEVATTSASALHLLDLNGKQYAEAVIDDTSRFAGCSGFDFDGDGAVEVVFAGQQGVSVIDGRTGETLLYDETNRRPLSSIRRLRMWTRTDRQKLWLPAVFPGGAVGTASRCLVTRRITGRRGATIGTDTIAIALHLIAITLRWRREHRCQPIGEPH